MANNDSKRKTLYYEQKGLCLYCEEPLKHWISRYCCLDHIYPKSRGGSNENYNLALVCYPCNALKSDFISLWEVFKHFWKMIRLFWHLMDVKKVQTALQNDGKMNTNGRTKIPNPIFKVGQAPIQAVERSLRIEAYKKREAAFQRIKGTPSGSAVRSEALSTSAQDS